MPEVHNLEPKNLSGKGGIGKGSQPRRGVDHEAYKRGYEQIDWTNYPKKDRDGSR